MNNHNEIKQLLAEKKFKSALLTAFTNSLKIQVTSKSTSQGKSDIIKTQIDLLKGLTTNISNPEALQNNHNLVSFHAKQLDNIQIIWNQNRQLLITIISILAGQNIGLDLSSLSSQTTDQEGTEIDNFVDFMLDDNEDNHVQESVNHHSEWSDDNSVEIYTEPVQAEAEIEEVFEEEIFEEEVEVVEEEIDEDEDFVVTAEQEKLREESWDELMDDLYAEEEESEEVVSNGVQNGVTPDNKLDEDWNEWLGDDDNDEESIDWSHGDWQEEEEEENLPN